MSKVEWRKLMRLGMSGLGLTPDVFWALTPAELMLIAGIDDAQLPMSRSSFGDLATRFPDKTQGVD